MQNINANALGYVVVTDYVQANTGKDVSGAIQKIIDEHPMRTIYFPDGEYILSKPICTSANPVHAVSLHLSNFAVLKAAEDWAHEEAMVRLGGSEPFNTIDVNGSNYSFYGGVVDGNMKAVGISIDSGRETSVRNVSIKHTQIGLRIKYGANYASSDADIETVNIVGNNKKNSIGVLVEGFDNTFTNMRIAAVEKGVVLQGGGNFLRNIHPLFIFDDNPKNDGIAYEDSVAFYDVSCNNWYDFCYSDQMATGFRIPAGSKASFINCFLMWYSPKGNKEVCFACEGDFHGTITNVKIFFREDTTNNAVLTLPEGAGGEGIIENPVVNDDLATDKTYQKFVTGKIIRA